MSKNRKTPISLRLDGHILEWFRREQPKGYQTLIHSVLEQYVNEKRQKRLWAAGRAQEIFRQYYARCFWHYDRNLKITVDNLDLVIEGLRRYGGRDGLLLSEELCR